MKEKVALVSCPSYDPKLMKASIVKGLEPFGGISAHVKSGDVVLLKPNMLSAKRPEEAVTTHPALIGSVIELVLDCGGKPRIGDSPGVGSLEKVARRTGIDAICSRYGVELVDFDDSGAVVAEGQSIYRRLKIARAVVESDTIFNLPKIKTHAQMVLTLGVKNLFGCIVGKQKAQWHFNAGNNRLFFARLLFEVYEAVRPAITISDGIIAMEGNGPGAGSPRFLGLIGCAKDAIAHDTVFSTLLGLKAEQLPVVQASMESERASGSIDAIDLISDKSLPELTLDDFELPATVDVMFNLPRPFQRFVRNSITAKPFIDHSLCTQCMECIDICPPGIIAKFGSRIEIDHESCISCFCCQEICPEKAITPKKGWLSRFVKR